VNRSLSFLTLALILIGLAARVPAPIVETTPEPTVRPRPTNAEPNSKQRNASTSRFDGTWTGTSVQKNASATYAVNDTLIIRSGRTADGVIEVTATLQNPQGWSFLPEEYKHFSPVHFKYINHSDYLVADGVDLMIRWAGRRLVDWNPKQLPIKYVEQWVMQNPPGAAAFTLKGDELVVAGSGLVYHRSK
jgi:hypothetical protein